MHWAMACENVAAKRYTQRITQVFLNNSVMQDQFIGCNGLCVIRTF